MDVIKHNSHGRLNLMSKSGALSACLSAPVGIQQNIVKPKPVETLKTNHQNNPRTHKSLAKTVNKSILIDQIMAAKIYEYQKEPTTEGLKPETRKFTARKLVIDTLMIGIVVTNCYVNFNIWQTNGHSNQAHASSITSSADYQKERIFPDGIVTTPISESDFKNYIVANDLPRAIYIKDINVSARIMPSNLDSNQNLLLPGNSNDAGWYTASAKPGVKGAMVIDGHSSPAGTKQGLFNAISELKNGDKITIERGDGVRFSYNVANVETIPLSDVDMGKLAIPYSGAEKGVNLIAPTGRWTSDKTTLDHRLIVHATL